MPLLGDAPQQQSLLGVANLTDTPGYAPPAGTNQGPVWDAYQSFKSGLFGAPGAFVQHYYDVMGQPNPITGGNAQQPGEISNIDKLATLLSGAAPSSVGSAIAPVEAGGAVLGAGPIRAYHGSPYNFDAFDLSKIGTGEGAQAYGHGLYFAENPSVAQGYRDRLSAGTSDIAGSRDPENVARQALQAWGGNPDKAKAALINQGFPDIANLVDGVRGRMYEVNLHADPASLLDWDKPFSQQSPNVQTALQSFVDNRFPSQFADLKRDPRGETIYNALSEQEGKDRFASQKLLADKGIPGIQYLDAGSRAAGDGTRNYVMFDPARIEILRKYGIGGLLAGGTSGAGLLGSQQAGNP